MHEILVYSTKPLRLSYVSFQPRYRYPLIPTPDKRIMAKQLFENTSQSYLDDLKRPKNKGRPFRVIGAGYSRTGTLSFTVALEKLLKGPMCHGGSLILTREEGMFPSRRMKRPQVLAQSPKLYLDRVDCCSQMMLTDFQLPSLDQIMDLNLRP